MERRTPVSSFERHSTEDLLPGRRRARSRAANVASPFCIKKEKIISRLFVSIAAVSLIFVFWLNIEVVETPWRSNAQRFLQDSDGFGPNDNRPGGGILNGGSAIGNNDNDAGGFGSEPSKGDKRCDNYLDRPCHHGDGWEANPVNSGLADQPPEDSDTDSTEFFPPPPFLPLPERPPENIVDLTIYVAMDPHTPSMGYEVTRLLTDNLNISIGNMNFYIDQDPPDVTSADANATTDDEETEFETIAPERSNGASLVGTSSVEGSRGEPFPLKRDHVESEDDFFNMFYTGTKSRVVDEFKNVWWWRYDINYLCYWERDGDMGEVSQMKMDEIGETMWNVTNLDLEYLEARLQNTTDSNVWLRLVVNPEIRGPEIELASETFPENLDVGEWYWSRYLGFGLLVTVCLGLVMGSQIGAIRRRKRIRKQVWGNLASEEGVKQLLNTGWILKDDRMEVYDKTRVGYRDNDSMLIGGFQQQEPGPGTEVVTPTLTLTHEDHSSTRGPSTFAREGLFEI